MTEVQPAVAQPGHRQHLRTVAGCARALLAVAIWSGWPVLTRAAVASTLTAEDLAALRFGFAGVVLRPTAWRRGFALDRLGWRGLPIVVIDARAPYVLLTSHGLKLATAA
ncbi:MAG: hypothetical protein ACREEP_01405 [Dongiaceae bacterium]